MVLAGGGHSHAVLLQRWAMVGTPKGLGITLVNRSSTALYSGTVPGLIGGLYQQRECRIDLRRLAEVAGVSLIVAEITGLELQRQQLLLRNRPPVRWDLLSLDVGAVTAPATTQAGDPIPELAEGLAIKPLEPFLCWWGSSRNAETPITVVGDGAAGLEVTLALAGHGRRHGNVRRIQLLSRHFPPPQPFGAALRQAGIELGENGLPNLEATVLLCTGSRAPAWLAASGLPCDPASGRVLTSNTLQVQDQPGIYASGDCAQIDSDPRPPAGVWAVRSAAPLALNLERAAQGLPGRAWHPPRWALLLLGDGGAVTGHPRAMAQWGPLRTPFHPLLWRLKQAIDRRFMHRFEGLAIGAMDPTQSSESDGSMSCHGCAAKLAAAPLAQAIAAALPPQPVAEDAHPLLVATDGSTWWQSVDGFPALVSDPWLNGRLTTLHACSDLWACGATVHSALAVVSLPRQAESLQAELLAQILAGIRSVLDPLGAALLGGHTLQAVGLGAETALPVVQLSVNGTSPAGRAWPKGGLQAGDALILTRELGSGVL
ncbi:MAG: AIR synthase related protein, partial [Prochlorococcaceae cyanobacterium]